jgi:hypothetical protein
MTPKRVLLVTAEVFPLIETDGRANFGEDRPIDDHAALCCGLGSA